MHTFICAYFFFIIIHRQDASNCHNLSIIASIPFQTSVSAFSTLCGTNISQKALFLWRANRCG